MGKKCNIKIMQEEKRAIWLKNNRKNSTDYENTA